MEVKNNMAYIFEEYNFKNYLHKNCHRDWFTNKYNIVYTTGGESGTRVEGTSGYLDSRKYVVNVAGFLRDPGIAREDDWIARGASALTAAGSGYVIVGSLALAPFTGGASLIPAALGAANAALQTAVLVSTTEEILKPEDVYFELIGDKSEWVAKDISPWYANGSRKIWDVARDLNFWSNQVYEERYVQQFQTYIQERPPTPF
jgi:hypothetical protein